MNSNKSLALGIDIGGTNLRVALVDEFGRILEQAKVPTPKQSEELLKDLKTLCLSLIQKAPHPILGVGVGWPGPVDRKQGRITQAPNISGLEQFPLTSFLQRELNLPAKLDNDAKCAALGEKTYGSAKPYHNFILLTFGTGIGGAIYLNDQLFYGKTGGAGEVGHMTIVENGVHCPCGNRGCFERYGSSIALERMASEKLIQLGGESDRLQAKITAKEVVENYESGEAWAVGLIDDFTNHVATGVASLVNIFDPEAIILAGGLFSSPHGTLLKLIEEKMKSRCFSSFQKDLSLLSSTLHGSAGIVGAAALARTQVLE